MNANGLEENLKKIFGHYEHPEELLGSEEDCYWLLDQALEQKKDPSGIYDGTGNRGLHL